MKCEKFSWNSKRYLRFLVEGLPDRRHMSFTQRHRYRTKILHTLHHHKTSGKVNLTFVERIFSAIKSTGAIKGVSKMSNSNHVITCMLRVENYMITFFLTEGVTGFTACKLVTRLYWCDVCGLTCWHVTLSLRFVNPKSATYSNRTEARHNEAALRVERYNLDDTFITFKSTRCGVKVPRCYFLE